MNLTKKLSRNRGISHQLYFEVDDGGPYIHRIQQTDDLWVALPQTVLSEWKMFLDNKSLRPSYTRNSRIFEGTKRSAARRQFEGS